MYECVQSVPSASPNPNSFLLFLSSPSSRYRSWMLIRYKNIHVISNIKTSFSMFSSHTQLIRHAIVSVVVFFFGRAYVWPPRDAMATMCMFIVKEKKIMKTFGDLWIYFSFYRCCRRRHERIMLDVNAEREENILLGSYWDILMEFIKQSVSHKWGKEKHKKAQFHNKMMMLLICLIWHHQNCHRRQILSTLLAVNIEWWIDNHAHTHSHPSASTSRAKKEGEI